MAPFKLFRRQASSQENDQPDQPANLVTTTSLNKLTTVMTSAHYLNIEESDQTSENSSLMSLNNDQRALLSSGSTAEQIGYSSPQLSEIPISPPPSYESVMKENQLLALDKENNSIQTTIHTNLLVESFYKSSHGSNNNLLNKMNEFPLNNVPSPLIDGRDECTEECTEECNRSSCHCNNEGGGNNNENCDGYDERCLENDMMERCSLDNGNNARENYNKCSDEFNNCSEDYNNCSDEYNNCSDEYNNYSNECQTQYQDKDYSNQYKDGGGQQINYSENKGPEILHKSSKELYKAVAKQCGLQCKMTDTCRCVDCQSRYFDCEFDQTFEKTDNGDGGLGAGTPMFINEVLHGTACTIL